MIDYTKVKFQRLETDTKIDSFHSADDDLNDFFLNEAKKYQSELLSVTYVFYYNDNLVAYFSLLNDVVRLEDTEKMFVTVLIGRYRLVNSGTIMLQSNWVVWQLMTDILIKALEK